MHDGFIPIIDLHGKACTMYVEIVEICNWKKMNMRYIRSYRELKSTSQF